MGQKCLILRKAHFSLKGMICITRSSDSSPWCSYFSGGFYFCGVVWFFLYLESQTLPCLGGKKVKRLPRMRYGNQSWVVEGFGRRIWCWWDQALAAFLRGTGEGIPSRVQEAEGTWCFRGRAVGNVSHSSFSPLRFQGFQGRALPLPGVPLHLLPLGVWDLWEAVSDPRAPLRAEKFLILPSPRVRGKTS